MDKDKCISCDSSKDPQCAYNPDRNNTCSKDTCYTRIVNGILFRGCFGDKIVDIFSRHECEADPKCDICYGGRFCNENMRTVDMCINCNSSDSTCRTGPDPKTLSAVCSLRSNSVGCYLRKTGDTYTRGCMEDLPYVDRMQCMSQSGACQSCMAPNCNQKIDFNTSCYECNGTDDARCARGENLTKVSCDGYSKMCISGIDASGFTHRGCMKYDGYNLFGFPEGFQGCFNDLCNDEVYPKDRTQCYQCEGVDCRYAPEQKGALILKPCLLVKDQCFSYISRGINNNNLILHSIFFFG